jgi:hypothetical protein
MDRKQCWIQYHNVTSVLTSWSLKVVMHMDMHVVMILVHVHIHIYFMSMSMTLLYQRLSSCACAFCLAVVNGQLSAIIFRIVNNNFQHLNVPHFRQRLNLQHLILAEKSKDNFLITFVAIWTSLSIFLYPFINNLPSSDISNKILQKDHSDSRPPRGLGWQRGQEVGGGY